MARGAKVTPCRFAVECIANLPRLRPHLLISDVGMPGMDGYSLIKEVRALSPEQGGVTPAIALTAHARSEDRCRAMWSGFDIHVARPVEPCELLAVVARLTRRK